jgi:hypothetical protein
MTNKAKQKLKSMKFLTQQRVRVKGIEKKNDNISTITRRCLRPQYF